MKIKFILFTLLFVSFLFSCKKDKEETVVPVENPTTLGTVTVKIDGKEMNFETIPAESSRFNFFRKNDKGVNIQRYATDKVSNIRVAFTYDLYSGGFPKEMTADKVISYYNASEMTEYVGQPQEITIKITSYKDQVLNGSYTGTLKDPVKGTKFPVSGSFSIKLDEI
jgi:hypothetical protein